jgi:hypothetical protein
MRPLRQPKLAYPRGCYGHPDKGFTNFLYPRTLILKRMLAQPVQRGRTHAQTHVFPASRHRPLSNLPSMFFGAASAQNRVSSGALWADTIYGFLLVFDCGKLASLFVSAHRFVAFFRQWASALRQCQDSITGTNLAVRSYGI